MDGAARYWDETMGEEILSRVGWNYADPTPDFLPFKIHVAFDAALFDCCSVNGETVIPQPSGFHGG